MGPDYGAVWLKSVSKSDMIEISICAELLLIKSICLASLLNPVLPFVTQMDIEVFSHLSVSSEHTFGMNIYKEWVIRLQWTYCTVHCICAVEFGLMPAPFVKQKYASDPSGLCLLSRTLNLRICPKTFVIPLLNERDFGKTRKPTVKPMTSRDKYILFEKKVMYICLFLLFCKVFCKTQRSVIIIQKAWSSEQSKSTHLFYSWAKALVWA